MVKLSQPKVVTCYCEDVFQPRLSAMRLDWNGAPADKRTAWPLPDGVVLNGQAPGRFGIVVQRHAPDTYAVRLVWNNTHLAWAALSRQQLLDSCLDAVLAAMGTDLHYLLDQPVDDSEPLLQADPLAGFPTSRPAPMT